MLRQHENLTFYIIPLSSIFNRRYSQTQQLNVMNKTYRQIYREGQQVECHLADFWGYTLRKTTIDKKTRPEGQAPPSVLKNITLRKFGKEIPKNQKILKIEDELQALQTERILMRITEEAASKGYIQESFPEEKSPIIKMMQGKIQQYNYIIDHKHLIDRGSDQTRKILRMQAKSNMEKVLQKIKGAREKLLTGDINNQIMLNKQMAKLYRTYRQQMDHSAKTGVTQFKSKTMVPQPAKSGHSKAKKDYFLRQLNDQRRKNSNDLSYRTYINNSQSDRNLFEELPNDRKDNHTEGSVRSQTNQLQVNDRKFQKYDTNQVDYLKAGNLSERTAKIDRDGLLTKLKPQTETKTIEPYIDKKQIAKYRQMQKNIRTNSQALQRIKNKLATVRNHSNFTRKQDYEQQSQTRDRVASIHEQNQRKQRTPPVIIDTSRREMNREAYALAKLQLQQKEQILANLLKRKHNRFNKIGGNRMIVKYDEHRVAKDMLEGDGLRNKPLIKLQDVQSLNSSLVTMQPKVASIHNSRRMVFPHELSYLSEQNDDEHYQRMCHNQKINLLFKKK